ncbi:helix-turn-helix domain-containing protein [Aquimarina sediminis]|uniref:helix-turn-helix domain-containing protein n=1 Tax=Aquimarina sediminis TaxID=2070536 RepID=UPI000CA02478|nr:helix-turn-helix domain-containing protein [Aquimarina sediminis]
MNKTSYISSARLAKYVDRIYVLKHSEKYRLPIMLPGTGLELLFHINTPFSVNKQKCDNAHVICPRNTIINVDKSDEVLFVSVRFRSGAFRHFSPVPYTDLNNQFASVEDIWGDEGRSLLDILSDCQSTEGKIRIIEKFLFKCLCRYHDKRNEKWDSIINSLYQEYNTISLKEFADITNLSYRQFERNFKTQFGITPKKFQRITRFQATIKKILLNKEDEYLSTALENGYYDQSHFINEFQVFVGMKPTQYFTQVNYDNHYYDKSIRR